MTENVRHGQRSASAHILLLFCLFLGTAPRMSSSAFTPPPPPSSPQVYSCSTLLDGDAVVVFFRALCAVSREELDASQHHQSTSSSSTTSGNGGGDISASASSGGYRGGTNHHHRGTHGGGGGGTGGTGARLYSLQRLLDCAAANSGRIRLIRSKLWSVTGAHLVMVACHPSPSVAVYAVNALYGLAQVWGSFRRSVGWLTIRPW